jgi:hypothetical protein
VRFQSAAARSVIQVRWVVDRPSCAFSYLGIGDGGELLLLGL